MEEWKTYKLGEVCSRLRSGKGIPSSLVTPSGEYPVIGGNGVRGYAVQSNFDGECGVIGRQGAYCGNVRYFNGSAYMTEHAIVVVGNEKADTYYLTALLSTMNLGHLSAQSAQPGLSVQTLSNQEITLPSIATQRRVSAILKSLDDKIELNTRINHNLEEQAQALYKSWFVDFESFKDGKFIESEFGLIPEGWSVKELNDVTVEIRDKVKDRNDVKVFSPVNTGKLMLSEEFFSKQVFSESISKYLLVEPYDFAYNPARVNIGSLGCNTFGFTGCVSPVYVVFRCQEHYHRFFDLYRSTNAFKEEVVARSIGGVRQTLGYKDFSLIKLVYPPLDVVISFNHIYDQLVAQQTHLLNENDRLESIRDSILPQLLSGELNIDEIDC